MPLISLCSDLKSCKQTQRSKTKSTSSIPPPALSRFMSCDSFPKISAQNSKTSGEAWRRNNIANLERPKFQPKLKKDHNRGSHQTNRYFAFEWKRNKAQFHSIRRRSGVCRGGDGMEWAPEKAGIMPSPSDASRLPRQL